MIIPVWVDPVKDKRLIEWLNTKTNKSATIRDIIYSYIDKIDFKPAEVKVDVKEEKKKEVNPFVKGFLGNVSAFKNK